MAFVLGPRVVVFFRGKVTHENELEVETSGPENKMWRTCHKTEEKSFSLSQTLLPYMDGFAISNLALVAYNAECL